MGSTNHHLPAWDAASVIRQGIESYVWFRLEEAGALTHKRADSKPTGDVVLTCDASGVIVGVYEEQERGGNRSEHDLVGHQLVDVIGATHGKALEQLLTRRPSASLGFKFVDARGGASHCRMMVRRTVASSGSPIETTIALFGPTTDGVSAQT